MIKPWFYREFKQHVAKKGYKLLRDDYKFIEKCIQNMPENEQRSTVKLYLEVWNTEVAGDGKTPPNQNLGRFKANEFLLKCSRI